MASLNAVTLAVTLSLLLLHAGARPDPDLAEDSAVVSVAVRDPQEEEIETTTVDLHRPIHLAAIEPEDLPRQIAHSFRLPLSRHASARPLRHAASLRPTIEIPYGDDMIGLPKADEKKTNKKMKKVHDEDDDDNDDDDFEIEQHKKMKKTMKKMMKKKLKKEENSGFMNLISGFLNRF